MLPLRLTRSHLLCAGLFVGTWAGWLPPLSAALPTLPQPAATPPPVTAATVDTAPAAVAARRDAVQQEIAATRAELAKLPEGMSDESARWLTQETALLERLDAVHAEQQRTGQHAADLAKEAADVEARTRNRRPVETTLPPPYGIALLDQLYAERDYLEQAEDWLKRDVANAETQLEDARDIQQEKDRARRAVRQAIETVKKGGKTTGNLRLAELESRLAHETLRLREQALRTLKLQQSLLAPKQKLLRPRLDWLRANLNLAAEETGEWQQLHAKRTAELELALVAAREAAETVTQTAIAAERRGAADKNLEELDARRADRQAANLTVSVLTAQRERLAEAAKVLAWRRHVLSGGMPSKEMRTLADENQEALDQLARERRAVGRELFRNRKDLQEWQGRLARAAAAGETSPPWSVERVQRLAQWIELSAAEVADLDQMRTARSRLQEEIGGRVNLFSWREGTLVARESLVAAWNYEVFSVDDAPVRIKAILAVLLLVGLGYHASRWLSAMLSRTLFRRLGLNTGRRAAWETLWFYALFLVVLVVAFNQFHISLTQFSVVSGALAVGIGFGSQNLIGNFISGIILLIERPVNQGDVIEVDGRRVTVERLGPRSTIVRTLDNTHVIVPNSRLLEQPVINWTLSDEVVRQQIKLGVAYGSPTRHVAELLQRTLVGVASVRKEPQPLVKFADFGESALLFEVYFWASLKDRLDTENELRHRIAEVFAAEKIVMAFPQRDVHLATTTPLHVVMVPAPDGAAGPTPPGP